MRIVPQARAGIVERLGRYHRQLEPGLALVIPFVDRVRPLIDLREQVVSFQPQAVITEDNLNVQIDTVLYYTVINPKDVTYEVANPIQAIEQLTLTTLRNIVGGIDLEEALTSRDTINVQLRTVLDEATARWGIRVNRVELKGIDPPPTITEAMEKQMRAERDKRATVLTAEGHKQAEILTAEGEQRAAILRAEGVRQAVILEAEGREGGAGPARGRRGPGDHDGVRRDPRGQPGPRAPHLSVPTAAPEDRGGRVVEALDHPQRGRAGDRQDRLQPRERAVGPSTALRIARDSARRPNLVFIGESERAFSVIRTAVALAIAIACLMSPAMGEGGIERLVRRPGRRLHLLRGRPRRDDRHRRRRRHLHGGHADRAAPAGLLGRLCLHGWSFPVPDLRAGEHERHLVPRLRRQQRKRRQ